MIAKRYYTENLRIAFPVILSFAGQQFVQVMDTIMVGRLGAVELSAVSLSSAIITNITMIGLGIAMALTPLTGYHFARNEKSQCNVLFRNSLLLNIMMGVVLCGLLFAINPMLRLFGQPQSVLDALDGYYYSVTLSLIPYLIFLTFKQYLEGLGNTFYSMLITLGCNVLNVFLNFSFIYGYMGFPELGVTGAGVATLISRIMMPIAFIIIIFIKKEFKPYFRRQWTTDSGQRSLSEFSGSQILRFSDLLKVGFPIAAQMTLELFSLTFMTIMMGWLGEKTLAANQIAQTMIGFSFMIANGVASASTILVSHDYGRRDLNSIKNHAFSAIHLGIAIMICFALLYAFGGEFLSRIFSTDEEVIAIATKLFMVVALFEIFDGTQVTALGALRGLTDVKRPMYYALICYILVEIPVGYILGFPLGLGAIGIVGGFMAGLILAATLFLLRFRKLVIIERLGCEH